MNTIYSLLLAAVMFTLLQGCKKEDDILNDGYNYYLVGFKNNRVHWQDTGFIVRTKNVELIKKIELQLALPADQRQLVIGKLAAGNGGYNKNAGHAFKWHLQEDAWGLADVTVEIYDGTPYSEVDTNIDYWLNTVQSYGPWSSYIRRQLYHLP